MAKLRELSYQEVTRRLRKLGFRFHRHGKGSHELWVRDADGRLCQFRVTAAKTFAKALLLQSLGKWERAWKSLCSCRKPRQILQEFASQAENAFTG